MHWVGQAKAARVVSLADGRSGSPGETRTRLVFLEQGLPPPELQFHVVGADGRDYVADFGWRDLRTVGEYDGRGKYAGESGAASLWSEKAREDAIRSAGWQVVRVVHEDLAHPARLRSRFAAAFERGLRAA